MPRPIRETPLRCASSEAGLCLRPRSGRLTGDNANCNGEWLYVLAKNAGN